MKTGRLEKYGEETIMLSFRVPKSKREEIKSRIEGILNEYVVGDGGNVLGVPLKEDFASEKIFKKSEVVSVEGNKKPNPDLIKKLQEIADGKGLSGVSSFLGESKKKTLDEIYDCVEAVSLPDVDSRVSVDSKGVSFYDRYDVGVWYALWDKVYYVFSDLKELNRFLKDNNLK